MRIRALQSHAEYLDAERFQRSVWRFPWREVIPLNELVVAQKNGGLVFGAFDGARLAGFCFGIAGFRDGRPYHYSRMLGVLPGLRDSGLGRRLKLHQRKGVLAMGLDLVRWTFDPLQSRNAYFNIEKLGVVIREYYENLYGVSGSLFNAGLPTDRFCPEWRLNSRRVLERIRGRRPTTLADAARDYRPAVEAATGGPAEPRSRRLHGARISVEIPPDIDALKRVDPDLAVRWRMATRKALVTAFRRGYVVTGFATGREGAARRSLYLLERNPRL